MDDVNSLLPRYIEVKSYCSKIEFYWSRNEMDMAEKYGRHYYIYLVNSDRIRESDYSPLKNQDPIKNINEESWSGTVEKCIISMLQRIK